MNACIGGSLLVLPCMERRRRSMFVAPGWHAVPTGGSNDPTTTQKPVGLSHKEISEAKQIYADSNS